VTGRVEDVRQFVDRAQIFVVPIRVGGGTRLKILEAMSMQKPVVSTTVGAEGISHQNGTNILLADDPQEFARQVSRLLKDSRLRQDVGVQGRRLVVERYDWTIIGNKMKKAYEGLLNG
jgi:glycosyltransferase involved in cell wall biosynthesis